MKEAASPSPDSGEMLVQQFLEGTLDDEGFATLQQELRERPEARDRYLEAVKLDALLREIASGKDESLSKIEGGTNCPRSEGRRTGPKKTRWGIALASAAVVTAGIMVIAPWNPRPGVAEVTAVSGARWVDEGRMQGSWLRRGDPVKLAKGSIEIRYRTGAVARLHGPVHFDVTSRNGGFLHYGQAWARADTTASEGFTVRTSSGVFVDRGTEFLTTAKVDGFSQVQVTAGAVDAEVEGFERKRIEKGSGMGIEPGDIPVMIRIESGDETPAFRFPTIPPPSAGDLADRARGETEIRLISSDERGRENIPHQASGSPAVILDGRGQSGNDRPEESFFFPNGATGMFLLDLGREVPVAKVHTYSWHLSEVDVGKRRRAVQRFTLWGAGEGDYSGRHPAVDPQHGWTRIARVDTDAFFGVEDEPDRPAQQACAIHSNGLAIGRFRYLLFQVIPTPMPDGLPSRHTFFGEIDVFSASTP